MKEECGADLCGRSLARETSYRPITCGGQVAALVRSAQTSSGSIHSEFMATEIQQEPMFPITSALGRPRDLWVVTKGRGLKDRPCHRVTKASWNLPLSRWTTACRWFFAERSSEFYFVSGALTDKTKRQKCEALRP